MTDILLTAVLPIFAVAAFGFIAGRTKLFDLAMAAVINRFVFYFPLPALSFNLLATARFDQFNWSLLRPIQTMSLLYCPSLLRS